MIDNRSLASCDLPAEMQPGDAYFVRTLFETTGYLVPNSLFAYHLFAALYARCTSVIGAQDSLQAALIGVPVDGPVDAPTRIRVWQLAVHPSAFRQGHGLAMLQFVRDNNPQLGFIEATVSVSNLASQAMFAKFAATNLAALNRSEMQLQQDFPPAAGEQDPEFLYTIGPFL